MCGFVFSREKNVEDSVFKESLNRIFHRGPDDVSFVQAQFGKLGFTRLAIMDLTTNGSQPFFNNKKYYMCNGEIYNFRNLKQMYAYNYRWNCNHSMLLYPSTTDQTKVKGQYFKAEDGKSHSCELAFAQVLGLDLPKQQHFHSQPPCLTIQTHALIIISRAP